MSSSNKTLVEALEHCSAKAAEIITGPLADSSDWPGDRRWWLQLGFNLGRFSELSGEGRSVWDAWKFAIETRDFTALEKLLDQMKNVALAENLKELD
ncbi:MAG: hypothetical protein WCJ40_17545 [Planctomycetota bacterium]